MILVTGATGNAGGGVVNGLLELGADVRGLVRPGSEGDLREGAEAAPGDLNDPSSLPLEGVSAVFLLSGYDGIEQSLSLMRDTPTMANELRTIRMALTRKGSRPEIEISDTTLAAIEAPTLLIWGDQDPFGGLDVAHRVAGAMPDATLRVVEGGGHLPWLDDPEEISTATLDFLLSSVPTAAG